MLHFMITFSHFIRLHSTYAVIRGVIVMKITTELMNELKKSECSLENYLLVHTDIFVNEDTKSFWKRLLENKRISKSSVINKSDFSYSYFYEVIRGKKIPTKDKIVRLSLAMELTIEECQQALKISGHSFLSPTNRRDSILIYAIEHKKTLLQCNNLLNKYGECELN